MIRMVDYQTLSIVLTGTGMIIALIYYALQIRNQNKTRQAQLFMQIYQSRNTHDNMVRWVELNSWEWEDTDDWMRKYGAEASSEIRALPYEQFATYDGIGLLVRDKMLDVNIVFQLMSEPIVVMWYKFETIVKWIRNGASGVSYLEHFEYLANEMILMRKQEDLPLPISRLHPTSTLHPEHKT